MKRIGIVVGAHPDRVMGGAQYQAACLAEALAAAGHSVFYLARQVPDDDAGYPYRIVGVSRDGGLARYGLLFDAARLTRALAAIRPHLVYQRVMHAYTGFAAGYGRWRGIPTIYHVSSDLDVTLPHPSPPHLLGWADQRVAAWGLRHADRIVVQTEHQAELLRLHHGRSADRLVRNFHPLPAEHVDKAAAPVTVLWIGNFKAVKRPELFVRLAEELAGMEGVRFVMLGRVAERYADLAARIAATPNLTAPGEVTADEVNRRLATGHLLVNTSASEGFPNTFIQAWMRRVPVLSLEVDPDRVLERHGAGAVAGSFEALKARLVTLLGDRALRESMGERAARYAVAHHGPDNVRALVDLVEATC